MDPTIYEILASNMKHLCNLEKYFTVFIVVVFRCRFFMCETVYLSFNLEI